MSPAVRPPTSTIPLLSDAVVTLRAPRGSDRTALVAYGGDPDLRRWTSVPQPYTPRDAENFLAIAAEGWARRSIYHFAICATSVPQDERLVGVIDLRPMGGGVAEIGFGLLPAARGRGLMSHAVRLLAEWAFSKLDYQVLHWLAHDGNWASRRVAWATGFRIGPVVAGLIDQRGTRVDGWMGTLRRGDPLTPRHAWHVGEPILGAPVSLRPLRPDDATRVAQGSSDPLTQHWMSGKPAPYTRTDAEGHLRGALSTAAEGKALFWAFASPEDDRFLGEIGLFTRSPDEGEIGYWTHPDARGQGLTTAAVRLAVRHALLPLADGGLGLRRLGLNVAAGNLASQRIAENVGFTRTGVDRLAERRRDGVFVDAVRFDLLSSELPAVR